MVTAELTIQKMWEVLLAPREIAIPGIADTSIEMIPEFWKHSTGAYLSIAVLTGYQLWTWDRIFPPVVVKVLLFSIALLALLYTTVLSLGL